MSLKYFGTDGVRGRVGEHPITADFMLKLGRAAGVVLARGDKRAVVIGKDTRISGYMFESALEAGLAAAGANVLLLGPMPTPAVAYLTRTLYACAGIVISASHNPYEDNGIKFFLSPSNRQKRVRRNAWMTRQADTLNSAKVRFLLALLLAG
jgi:phosphoglucosamine mutase